MKTLVVYDSVYGNTEEIAKAIGDAISGEIKMVHISAENLKELAGIDLLIIGSPTHGGRPTRRFKTSLIGAWRLPLRVSMWPRSTPDTPRC